MVEVQAGHVGSGALAQAGGAPLGREIVDEDVDVFAAGEMAGDLGVDPGNGLKFSRPVFGVMRPGDPGGGVGSPLGGHAVVLVAWCRHFGVPVLFLAAGVRRTSTGYPTPCTYCVKSSIERTYFIKSSIQRIYF